MLDNNYKYQLDYTIEFDTYRLWTGNENLTLATKVYESGKIISIGDILLTHELDDSSVTFSINAISVTDRTYFNQDHGPLDCTIQLIWRKRRLNAAWQPWNVGVVYEGKMSDGTYDNGVFSVRVQRVFDDIWRGHLLRWTGSDQRRRFPGDTSLDRAEKVRRSGLLLGWQA